MFFKSGIKVIAFLLIFRQRSLYLIIARNFLFSNLIDFHSVLILLKWQYSKNQLHHKVMPGF